MTSKVLIVFRRCTGRGLYLLPKDRINQLCFLTLALILAGLAGCAQQEALPIPPTPGFTPTILATLSRYTTPTETPTRQPILTQTPSPVPSTPTSTTDLPPETILRYQPLEIAPDLPTAVTPPGTLIIFGYGGNPSFFVNFAEDSSKEIPKDITCISTSPDGRWLAYCQGSKPFARDWLIVESADGQEKKKLPIDKDWFFSHPDWLDNRLLVFDLWKDKLEPLSSILPVEVVNPFTGERQELASDYPDLFPSNAGPGGSTMYFVTHTVVYHPSLSLVVYPKTPLDNDRAFVVLWDRKANQEVASMEVRRFGQGSTPLWSPDGEQFVIAFVPENGLQSVDSSELDEEWFSVSREGKVQQLTHFGDYFSDVEIGRARWSPDGQYLAFFLTTKPTQCGEGENLSVMDMKTWQVTNYCVPGVMGIGGPSPIWSPDSRYVAFNDSVSTNHHVVVVDIEQGWAAQIAGDLYPMGWLETP